MDPEQNSVELLKDLISRIDDLEDKVSDYEIRISALESWADDK